MIAITVADAIATMIIAKIIIAGPSVAAVGAGARHGEGPGEEPARLG